MSNSKKGSQWRKWDLHVHTPASMYQMFGANDEDTWERYLLDLEALPPEFQVIGVNDYFFLDGYQRLLREKYENKRLQNLVTLFPVVEFRIDKFAGVDFGQLRRMNLHVIFSNEVTVETIQSQFLNTLEQSYVLESGEKWTRAITPQSVEELGKTIKSNVPADQLHKYQSDIIEGFRNLNVSEDKVYEALEKDCFKGKYLTAIGKTEWADMKWTNASIATKKSVINRADLVFTAAKDAGDFNNAKAKLSKEGVNDLLLDCSDAHYLSTSTDKDRIGNCLTWIKADPTFEGLKQIIFEPTSRIAIQEFSPENKTHYHTIDRIELHCPEIGNSVIELNENLNAIIGGRSTGKSVLLAAIAQKHSIESVIPEQRRSYGAFVREVANDIRVIWKDGREDYSRDTCLKAICMSWPVTRRN